MSTTNTIRLAIADIEIKTKIYRQALDHLLAASTLLESIDTTETLTNNAAIIKTLTPRQNEIFALLGSHSPKEIAVKLKRSQKTIEAHRETMRKKFGVESSEELARIARNP